jgi:uncharacterized RDD family membrane protein YckC
MNEDNPYHATGMPLECALPRLDIDSAPKVRRFFNWLIDRLVIMGILFAFGFLVALTGNQAAIERLQNIDRITDILVTWTFMVGYYTLMEGMFGFTVGKLITGTRVVDEYGRAPAFRRTLLRSLCRLIPFNALSLLMSDEETRRAWHDSIPKTYVINRLRPGATAGKQRHRVSSHFGSSAVPTASANSAAVVSGD